MLSEHYASIAIQNVKEGKRKLALAYLRLACLQTNTSDYIYLLRLEAEVWEGEWSVALTFIDRVQPIKLADSEQCRYYWVCARLFNALGKKRRSLTYFNWAMERNNAAQWQNMMRELRLALPLEGRVTKQLLFPGGFANKGCMLHIVSKQPQFITKFIIEHDNYYREAFFYQHCISLLTSDFILEPAYYSGLNNPSLAISLPYVNQSEDGAEPIELIPKIEVVGLIKDLAKIDLDVADINRLRVPAFPLSLGRNMVNFRNVLFNTHNSRSFNYLRLMLVYSLRNIENLPGVSGAAKQYALDIGFFFLKKHPFKAIQLAGGLDNGLCHSDLKADNIIQSRDDKFYIIDWGNLSFGPLGYDIGVFVSEANLPYLDVKYLLHDYFPFSTRNKFFTWWVCYFHCLRNLEKKKENHVGEALLFLRNNIMSMDSNVAELR